MFHKIIAAVILIACAIALMPVKSTHAAVNNVAAFEPKVNVVIGSQARTGRISYSIQFNIGQDATLIEIAPAGSNVWTTFLDQRQQNALVINREIGYFSQVIYNTNVFDFRVNGVVWHNVAIANDRLVVLGYDYEPVIVFLKDNYRQ